MITGGGYPFITITASLANGLLTVTSVINGTLSNGLMVGGLNVPANMFITGQNSGAPGGTGVYTVGCYSNVNFGSNQFFPTPAAPVAPSIALTSQQMLVAPWTLNISETLISQYANSPTILALINNANQYVDPQTNLFNFYNQVWNVNSAVGYGLDVWGRIVGVRRNMLVNQAGSFFNFKESGIGTPFGPGGVAPFTAGVTPFGGGIYRLSDALYRLLIMAKALANISICTAMFLNGILKALFGGTVWCSDTGGMVINIYFQSLNLTQLAILTTSGVLPRPVGVLMQTQTGYTLGQTFLFREASTFYGTPFGFNSLYSNSGPGGELFNGITTVINN